MWLHRRHVAATDRRLGVVCRCVDQTSGCAQNSPLWHAAATVAISGNNVPDGASAPVQAGLRAK
jgi:hypothetical protein